MHLLYIPISDTVLGQRKGGFRKRKARLGGKLADSVSFKAENTFLDYFFFIYESKRHSRER